MIAGLTGHLVSSVFLDQRLANQPLDGDRLDAARRAFTTWRSACANLGPASSLRAMLDVGARPLAALLGFDAVCDVAPWGNVLAATLRSTSGHAALLVTPWGERLDPLARPAASEAIRRGVPWALLFNGRELRISPAGGAFNRRHVGIDLDVAADDPWALHALAMLTSATVSPPGSQPGEPTPLHVLVNASDEHAVDVCRSLKDGVLAASCDLLTALVGRRPRRSIDPLDRAFEQSLTIVYRMLFLLFAEGRALVPTWHPVYRDSYTVEAMRRAAEGTGTAGLWDALRAMTRLAHAGCAAGDLVVTPFNGRLFAPSRTPLAERRDLDDGAVGSAVRALTTRLSRRGRESISYRDLGVEQLGAVYETLLEYQPQASAAGVTLARGSGVRKATGTFYTPQPIAEYLVRQTLAPLVEELEPDQILRLRIVDPAMGSGAFLVAACRFLAGVYEGALVRTGACHPGDLDEPRRAAIRRLVAERCLYGVDLNPMAVQLARLSIWLATLAADRPLSFLDHRLQVGNSVLGTWLSLLGTAPRAAGRRRPGSAMPLLFEAHVLQDALAAALPVRFSLESVPNDTVEAVRAKERALAAMARRESLMARWKRVADFWCAVWLSPGRAIPPAAFGDVSDALLGRASALPSRAVNALLTASEAVARARRLFHWELEFPEVFFAADGTRLPNGGFDAVVGNPPWEMMREDAGAKRSRGRASDVARVVRFTRDSGIYTAQSTGHANLYQLFLERSVALCRRGGRIGLALPAGMATDAGSARLRRELLARCRVDALVGFDNRHAVFPIHRSVRFVLLTAERGRPTDTIACRFGLDDVSTLDGPGEVGRQAASPTAIRLSVQLLERLSGRDASIPWLEGRLDLAICERAAALFPPFGDKNGWNGRFGRELNATEDRRAFGEPGRGFPVVEGKQLEPFRADLASNRYGIDPRAAARLLRDDRHRHARLAYRDVASATNRLTLIAAILPAGCVSTHTVFCLRTRLPPVAQQFLCGIFNSFVVNHLVRLRVTTHVTTGVVEGLPIPTPRHAGSDLEKIAAASRLLGRRFDTNVYAALQARVAGLYQLTREEFAYVLSRFPLVEKGARDAALREFDAI